MTARQAVAVLCIFLVGYLAGTYAPQSGSTDGAAPIAPAGAEPSRTASARPPMPGILVSKADLRQHPTDDDPAWTDLVDRVDDGIDEEDLSIEVDSDGPSLVYGAALIWARTDGDPPASWDGDRVNAYRNKVRDKLTELVTIPLNVDRSATRPARRIGAYALAADLIELAEWDPDLHAAFERWLRVALFLQRPDGFLPSVWDNAMKGVGNTGFAARFSAVTAMVYLQDQAGLDDLWLSWRRIFDNTIDHEFAWAVGDAHGSWQGDPRERATEFWYGVLPDVERNGNDMSGVIPADIRRSSGEHGAPDDRFNVYDPRDFPGGMYTNYVYLSSHALLLTAEVLHRAGYPARTFGDSGPLRVAMMIRRFADTDARVADDERPWRYYDINEAHAQQVVLINAMYPAADFPSAGHGQRPTHLLGFHEFTHQRRLASADIIPRPGPF